MRHVVVYPHSRRACSLHEISLQHPRRSPVEMAQPRNTIISTHVYFSPSTGSKVADMPEWRSRLIPDHDQLPADTSGLPTILIDGHYIIFRSFYAMPALTTRDGTPVGALLGFCNVINELVSVAHLAPLGVAFDQSRGATYSGGISPTQRCFFYPPETKPLYACVQM